MFVHGVGCIRQRPDFLYDFCHHVVVLEVDEDQHKMKDTCEETRMVNMAQSFQKKTVFVRYNPDEYVVSGEKNPAHEERMVTVKKWLHHLEDVGNVENTVSCIHLFSTSMTEKTHNLRN